MIASPSYAACSRSNGIIVVNRPSCSSVAGGDLAPLRRAVVAPRRRAQPVALDMRLRKLVEEPRREVVRTPAVEHARRRMQQRQPLHGTRHPDVTEPPLLLDPLL